VSGARFDEHGGQDVLAPDRVWVPQAAPPWFSVRLFNAGGTPLDFVATLLQQVFGQVPPQAFVLAETIHRQGQGTVGRFTRDVAETRAAWGWRWTLEAGHPLRLEVVPG
jgi:ATP-dependent Clp protease adaptor protein ClpS